MSNAETGIMRDILVALSQLPESLWWRQNTGVFRSYDGREIIRQGIPGMADIGGMIGGRAVQVEVKTATGKLSKEQVRWQRAVERAGGIFLCARSPAGVLASLAAHIDAQSCEPHDHSDQQQPASVKLAGNGEAVS